MFHKIISLLLCAVAINVNATFAQAKLVQKVSSRPNEIVIPFEKYVLPNGLTVVVHEDHSDPVVHVDVTYHVGSAREEIGKSGFAHFFEHMMFQGSDNVADEQHFKIISEAGGTLNGSTNRDRTNYYETVPSNQLEKMLWLEADRMGFLLDAVTQQKFEIQRATVKNERGQNYDNRPYGLIGEVSSKNLYPYGHPYSWLTIGYIEDLNRSDVNDLKNFFLRWYGPNNATLTVGGDVKTADVVRLAQKYFGSVPRGPKVSAMKLPAVKLASNRYASYVDNYARTPQMRILYPTVPDYHKDEAALACLAQIIGSGKTSVLYQSLVKSQKALNANAFSSLNELAGEFVISVTPLPGSSLADMEKMVNDALVTFEKRGVTADDITKFKSQFESRTINGLASVSGKVSQLAAFQTYLGNPDMIGKQLKNYQAVTIADVLRVYNIYIKNKYRVVVSALPKGKEDAKPAADNYTVNTSGYKAPDYGYNGLKYTKAKDNFDRKIMPLATKSPLVNVPAFWTNKLANGMQAIGTRNNEIPSVTLSIILKGGKLLEANDLSKAGLTNLFAAIMNEDTKDRTAEEFSRELEKLGSSIFVSNGIDGIYFTVQSLRKNLDPTLKLLEERMLRPDFTEEDFTRLKKQVTENINNNRTTPSVIAGNVFAAVIYGTNNILGLPDNGTAQTVANINLKDLQDYYANFISSADGRVVIVGDIQENEILPKLAFLNKLPSQKINFPSLAKTPSVEKTKIYIVDVPNAAQTEFRVGHLTDLTYDATGDYYKAGLANYNFGGSFNSRVNINLREAKGWTYGARSGFSADKYSGSFVFSSGIKAAATDSALYEVLNELAMLRKDGFKDDEVVFMQNSIGQSDARNYETGPQKAAFIGRILQYNLPADYVKQQNNILNAITRSELSAINNRYINPDKMNIVLVGDKKKILSGLSRFNLDIIELDADGTPKQN